jgi:hypothetical protein
MKADALPVVRCRLLGPLRLETDRAALSVPGGVQRAVLGALLLAGPDPVAAARLLEVVWGEAAPHGGLGLVQVTVSRLRGWLDRQLAGAVEVAHDSAGDQLRLHRAEVDLWSFRATVAAAEGAGAAERVALLDGALGRWRGPVLSDVPPGRRDEVAVAAVDREHTAAVLAFAAAVLEVGDAAAARRGRAGVAAGGPGRRRTAGRGVAALRGPADQAGRGAGGRPGRAAPRRPSPHPARRPGDPALDPAAGHHGRIRGPLPAPLGPGRLRRAAGAG